jgi:hypothetical protein
MSESTPTPPITDAGTKRKRDEDDDGQPTIKVAAKEISFFSKTVSNQSNRLVIVAPDGTRFNVDRDELSLRTSHFDDAEKGEVIVLPASYSLTNDQLTQFFGVAHGYKMHSNSELMRFIPAAEYFFHKRAEDFSNGIYDCTTDELIQLMIFFFRYKDSDHFKIVVNAFYDSVETDEIGNFNDEEFAKLKPHPMMLIAIVQRMILLRHREASDMEEQLAEKAKELDEMTEQWQSATDEVDEKEIEISDLEEKLNTIRAALD